MRSLSRVVAVVLALLLLVGPGPSEAQDRAEAAAMPAGIDLVGRGFGHGRGMGQWGAFGYATGRSGGPWTHRQILAHFYGGTTENTIGNLAVSVLLQSRRGTALVVERPKGLRVDGVEGATTAVRATLRPDGRVDLQSGPGCAGPWSPWAGAPTVNAPVRVRPVDPAADPPRADLLRLCMPGGGTVSYRGDLALVGRTFDGRDAGVAQTVNLVDLEGLLRGVLPREMPASWGDAEGGRGMAALRAQAVAARSYAAAGDSRWGDLHSGFGAAVTTCDTIFCQAYGGAAVDGTSREHPNTDRATFETAGQVRWRNGAVARTEFSASTGGWTAGGTFPVVEDVGDAISTNTNHRWTTTVARATIEARWNLGTLQGMEVIERNGVGEWGGRVLRMRLVGTERSTTVTGNEFRSALGLRSNWFSLATPADVPPPRPAVQPRSIDSACPEGRVPPAGYSDVTDANVHRRAIECVTWWGVAEGTGAGRFDPSGPVTRGQMAGFVARLVERAGGTLPEDPPDAFVDDDGTTHEHRINQLAAVGVVRGVTAGRYVPGMAIDRAQLASLLDRALRHLGLQAAANPGDWFADDEDSVHQDAINRLAGDGVVVGTAAGFYEPRGIARRDQMATTLARSLDLLVDRAGVALPHG